MYKHTLWFTSEARATSAENWLNRMGLIHPVEVKLEGNLACIKFNTYLLLDSDQVTTILSHVDSFDQQFNVE